MESVRRGLAAAACTLVLASGSAAFAGETFQLSDDDSRVSIGARMRGPYISDPDASNKNDFSLNSARISTNGQFTKIIGFTDNIEIARNTGADNVNGLADDDNCFILTSHLINQKIGIGKFQSSAIRNLTPITVPTSAKFRSERTSSSKVTICGGRLSIRTGTVTAMAITTGSYRVSRARGEF